jgi:Zn finger protein HypA/HybF involved in hydrogenase expression
MDIQIDKLDLKPNQAVCFNCGNVLTSNDQYDMVTCPCGAMAIDGGDYLRVIELEEKYLIKNNSLFKLML